MSEIIKIKERKDDGWFWDKEQADFDKRGIYPREMDLFESALLTIFSDSEKYERFINGTLACRKAVIFEALNIEISAIIDNLRYDLENNVKICPLVKRDD